MTLNFTVLVPVAKNVVSWFCISNRSLFECSVSFPDQIRKLSALGFHPDDCKAALIHCNGHLDDAALWLTHHADLADTAVQGKEYVDDNHSILSFNTLEVHYCYMRHRRKIHWF
jgi:hypothetical protein